ncbi:acetate--CoA ligase family protein [Patescibacteria group bacterium]
MPSDLATFFYPKSVAIIGASRSPEKLGAIILKNIKESGFTGSIYPVNPNAKEIDGLQAYADLPSVPEAPELIIIAIPACQVVEVLKQAGQKGSKNVVVLSAGFKEVGEEGQKLEKQLVEVAKEHEINLLGPNCLGFINNFHPINATFGEPVKETGNLRFITQSGAIASGLFDWCNATGLGLSEFVTLGNKAGLNENDILEYFYNQDQNTLTNHNGEGLSNLSPIGLYLESIADGCKFLDITKKITKTNPIFIIKPGKTEAAAKAMQSHTGAIAGADNVLDAVLKQAGVVRCQTLEDFFDLSRAFAWENLPDGRRVAVVSNAGGPAVISADAVIHEGLELAEFDEATKNKLEEALPRSASIVNPVDVLGDALADRFSESLDAVLQTDTVDALIVILTPQIMTQIGDTAETIGEMSKKHNKPILCAFIGGKLISEGEKILNQYKIPSFRYPERAIAALGSMWKFKEWQMKSVEEENKEELDGVKVESEDNEVRQIIQEATNKKYKTLDNISADKILKSIGIMTPPTKNVKDLEEAKTFAIENGWPVVLKLSSPGLLHKKEVGGVIIDIINEKQLNDAWHKMERKIEQLDEKVKEHLTFQIQKAISEGVEVIVGFKHDPTFGAVLLFGAGGSYAELIADRNLHLLPITKNEIINLVERSKVYTLLKETHALDKLYDLILRVAKLETMIPEATDVEINPVIVTLNDVWAVDGKIIMKETKAKPVTVTPPQMKNATTLKHEVLAEYFHYYEVETEEPFEFEPGQYISIKVAPTAIRAYSIATKLGPNKFALLVDIRPGGPGSKFFEQLKEGDKIPFLGPFGAFTLKVDEGVDKFLFLGTGSGMSAIRCMIDSVLKEHKVTVPVKLYFGLTFVKEIFWQDHFEELKKEFPNFDYEISIFKPDETWTGHQGFVTEVVEKDCPDAAGHAAYLCGHRAMIADATELLLKHGCPKDNIYTERFV